MYEKWSIYVWGIFYTILLYSDQILYQLWILFCLIVSAFSITQFQVIYFTSQDDLIIQNRHPFMKIYFTLVPWSKIKSWIKKISNLLIFSVHLPRQMSTAWDIVFHILGKDTDYIAYLKGFTVKIQNGNL